VCLRDVGQAVVWIHRTDIGITHKRILLRVDQRVQHHAILEVDAQLGDRRDVSRTLLETLVDPVNNPVLPYGSRVRRCFGITGSSVSATTWNISETQDIPTEGLFLEPAAFASSFSFWI
jgi:hypothetical protein